MPLGSCCLLKLPDGSKNVPVGKIIALLAEEGDNISNLEVPKDEHSGVQATTTSTPAPETQEPQHLQSIVQHSLPPSSSRSLLPSVLRLVQEHGISNLDAIEGTGIRGMLTKGDILTHLGRASGPNGTYKIPITPIQEANQNRRPIEKKEEYKVRSDTPIYSSKGMCLFLKPLDGPALRRAIVNSFSKSSLKEKSLSSGIYRDTWIVYNPLKHIIGFKNVDFHSVINDYLPPKSTSSSQIPDSSLRPTKNSLRFLDGLV